MVATDSGEVVGWLCNAQCVVTEVHVDMVDCMHSTCIVVQFACNLHAKELNQILQLGLAPWVLATQPRGQTTAQLWQGHDHGYGWPQGTTWRLTQGSS